MLATRSVGAVAVLLAVTVVVFLFVHLAPGGPEQALAGREATPEQLAAIRARYGLDDPLWQQYLRYLGALTHLDLGTSLLRREPVTRSIGQAAGVTAPLVLISWLLAAVAGTALGMFTALRAGSRLDRVVLALTVLAASTPVFATGLLLAWVFGIQLDWLPVLGAGRDGGDRARYLVLPILTTTLVLLASSTRFARVRIGQILEEDQVTFARARGLSTSYVLVRIVLRNAAVQTITLSGAVLIAMLGGLVVVEQVFALPGLGTLLVTAIGARDIPVIQGVTLVVAVAVVVVNLVVDLLCLAVDPRMRRGLEVDR
ncbi:MAG TPA: ABC transporter permease [Pseudonocardia sp.]|uniref:ABC transporter permease n=1 Tax=Pseudonocardia sp. TaxID=60912 RepID=UPI002B4B8D83|nr:ABC transporter permease [Pseudonocardia sp.]HLU55900.1 ABC transporter permease [Pseudonocardia sp.]